MKVLCGPVPQRIYWKRLLELMVCAVIDIDRTANVERPCIDHQRTAKTSCSETHEASLSVAMGGQGARLYFGKHKICKHLESIGRTSEHYAKFIGNASICRWRHVIYIHDSAKF